MEQFDKLEKTLGYTFTQKRLLKEALTHKSYKKSYDNERLEFLGDAVLDLIVGEYLYNKFDKYDEGKLSKMRASLVNEDGFTHLANALNIGEFILLSNAEQNNGGRTKSSLLSNAFEALIGAVYLEGGLENAKRVTVKLIEENYEKISLDTLFRDYKTALQELTQARFGTTPEYKLLSSSGPDHKKEFCVAVFIQDKQYASSSGKSKKIAQQEAALLTLKQLQGE